MVLPIPCVHPPQLPDDGINKPSMKVIGMELGNIKDVLEVGGTKP